MLLRWLKILRLWLNYYSVANKMKAAEQYFPVVLLVVLCKVAVAFSFVDETVLTFK